MNEIDICGGSRERIQDDSERQRKKRMTNKEGMGGDAAQDK